MGNSPWMDSKLGQYTIEAETEWQGAVYKGEAQIKLIKKADYQKLVEITLSK